ALALSIPFAYGNVMRLMGKKGFFLKNSEVIERLAKIDTIVFDKTGTITQNDDYQMSYFGDSLNQEEQTQLKSLTRHSTHPLSMAIYKNFSELEQIVVEEFRELPSRGLIGQFNEIKLKIGSEEFINGTIENKSDTSSTVFISFNEKTKGYFKINTKYRSGLEELIDELANDYDLHLISGDNSSEKENLIPLFKDEKKLHFNQSPQDKLEYIKTLQKEGRNVLMIGDGLNDAGALNASNASISIADDVYHFSPACDAILEASKFKRLSSFLKLSGSAIKVVKSSFILSFLYNVIGMYFAVSGMLSPIIAAILMPLSSVSVVAYVTLTSSMAAKRIKNW
ncbi:MAG: heavy metal translocating P-type ATPase, partial [Bacteroidetes bacterium]